MRSSPGLARPRSPDREQRRFRAARRHREPMAPRVLRRSGRPAPVVAVRRPGSSAGAADQLRGQRVRARWWPLYLKRCCLAVLAFAVVAFDEKASLSAGEVPDGVDEGALELLERAQGVAVEAVGLLLGEHRIGRDTCSSSRPAADRSPSRRCRRPRGNTDRAVRPATPPYLATCAAVLGASAPANTPPAGMPRLTKPT